MIDNYSDLCYACYGTLSLPSHRKTQDGAANVTDVTDVTSNRRGCTYRASVGERARARHVDTPLSNAVTSVTSVTCPALCGGFDDTVCRNIGVHVTPNRFSGVVR